MKLRNKKTGEIVDLIEIVKLDGVSNEFYLRLSDSAGRTFKIGFNSLAELNEGWEDYEEPKEYWYIDYDGGILCGKSDNSSAEKMMKSMGNHFESLEEAEKAVEKIKAITRLNKCGFRFEGYTDRDRASGGDIVIYGHVDIPNNNLLEEAQPDMLKDLDLLFGGEE